MKSLESIKRTIIELCAIPSVQGEAEEGKPFGKEVRRALDYMLDLGCKMGFDCVNYDGYVGEIVWQAEKKPDGSNPVIGDTMGILCHLDVVKAGRLVEWKYPPFSPVEEDGRIYARGTLDDKGPAVSVLYMMKELKDEGFKPTKTIKLILGCNEETGWGCIAHYKKVAKMPDFGFSPDGNFPVLYAEKGIMHPTFSFKCDESIIVDGGEMANMVCDYARAIAPIDVELAKKCGVKITVDGIESFGESAHGSTPEKGKNAIQPLLKYLTLSGLVDKNAYDMLFDDVLNLKANADETGHLTMSPNIVHAKNGEMKITVDFRYPSTYSGEFMIESARKIAPFDIKTSHHQLPLFNKKDGPLITKLLNIYNEETHSDLVPEAIGGGTYARALPIGAAFGPEFPGEEALIHQPNEYITVSAIERMSVIYKRTIKELTEN